MIQKETPSLILGPSRKSRTKIRKPKFLSLRLALSTESTQHSGEMPADHRHQLNLFPLHPENLVEEDHKVTHDDDVAYFFSAADGGATTITGLLGGGSASDVDSCNNVTNSSTTLSTPDSLTYAYGGQDREGGGGGGTTDQQIVRTAMRNKERDPTSEEKWVCYSEVTNSSGGVSVSDLRWKSDDEKMIQRQKRLSLKLDYEEIYNECLV